MDGLAQYLNRMYAECRIPFKVYLNEKNIFEADPKNFGTEIFEDNFLIGSYECRIIIPLQFKESISLIKFFVKDKFEQKNNGTHKVIADLLEGIKVQDEDIRKITQKLDENSFLVVINVTERLQEAVEILKDVYIHTDILIIPFKQYVLLLGSFENIQEHTSSIYETLYTSIYEKCYISYIDIGDFLCLKSKFDSCISKLDLAKKYNVSGRIFSKDSLMFESIIDNLNENEINRIINKFDEGFKKLADEIIQSIDIFFEMDLNISEAAKKLYVHRNTLIYRLDKIQKYTSYDIRKFNDAVIFKIAFEIWKIKR